MTSVEFPRDQNLLLRVPEMYCGVEVSDVNSQVIIKTLTGKKITVEVCIPKMKVSDLKQKIFEKEEFPPHQQRLIFACKELEDDAMLSAYKIQPNCTIHILLRLRGCEVPCKC
jgi:ubiquitin